ncbi:radical SAM protein [Oceanispirochaeta sp.]|jgi:putative pyruvate formate lyase activating enzyme|uniref:radical SAM protein n=1 Tax=Oceanispirochaeta sp. TaxID=2035350 RepID=UPI0026074D00|nr:radical SAM protein [Oceanispirochaeta sp.]MDA3957616.1 radical SAM protein [Oceanispirochaeta sp.]
MDRKKEGYRFCTLCGRDCCVDRYRTLGYCKSSDKLKLAWAGLHFGEEPPITGKGGSGTVFFTGCTLGCPFCQNFQISRQGMGRELEDADFLKIVRALRERGAENLNLVTPSPYIPTLVEILPLVRDEGFPLVWNSSGQEMKEAMKGIFPLIDIFLPDLKTLDKRVAKEYYHYKNYPSVAEPLLLEMADRKPLVLDERGVMKQGLLLRHLVLPGELESTAEVLKWFAKNLKGRAMLSIMSQYTPVVTPDYPEAHPDRFLSGDEYDQVVEMLYENDLDDGFIQDWVTGSDWLPDFNRINPFSSDLSSPLWHWKDGFV